MKACSDQAGHLRRPSASRPRIGGRPPLLVLVATALFLPACSDGPLGPAGPEPEAASKPALKSATMEVVAPTDGAELSGTTTFAARLTDWQLHEYKMFWSVDAGSATYMADSPSGEDRKEADVDVSGWDWNGAGPYTVTFEARSQKGNKVVATERVDIFIAAVEDPVVVDPAPGANPLAGAALWVDPYSNARRTADEWYATRPADALDLEKIAGHAQADWFGDWNGDVRAAVDGRTSQIVGEGALPVYVAYNIPLRDCGSYSGGGAADADGYRRWIRDFAAGLAGRTAAVVLEPDALSALDCLNGTQRDERFALLNDAVDVLTAAGAAVYLDAGHPAWQPVDVIADRLLRAGVDRAAGFALNVSNFLTTADNVTYGAAISDRTQGARFVIDTSRNGLGPTADHQWCNPDGRALGDAPTTAPSIERVDALLWIKRPGESDGTCNGGPQAGAWWADYALGLAQRATHLEASTMIAANGDGVRMEAR